MQLSAISQDNLNILLNKEIIAINQDPQVGTSIAPFKWGVNVCIIFFYNSLGRGLMRSGYSLIGLMTRFTQQAIGLGKYKAAVLSLCLYVHLLSLLDYDPILLSIID